MKKNNKGFSIIIGMGLMVLIVLAAYVILAFIVPFMKSTRGIENISNAYYQSYKGIEQSLYHVKTRTSLTTETGGTIGTNVRYTYKTFSSGTTIPIPTYGNSEYSSGHNIISLDDPIQLEIGGINGLWNANITFVFKVPDFKGGLAIQDLSGTTTPIINWSLSSSNNTLMANGTYLKISAVNGMKTSGTRSIRDLAGLTLFGDPLTFGQFYQANCNSFGSGCVLKMFLLDELKLKTNNTIIPYLEYQINFDSNKVADRYTRIESTGISGDFQKKLDMRVPQQTVSQSFDFTVF